MTDGADSTAEFEIPAAKWNADRNGEFVGDLAKADARSPTVSSMVESTSRHVTAALHTPTGSCHRRFPIEKTAGNVSDMPLLAVGISGTPHGPLQFNGCYRDAEYGQMFFFRQNTQPEVSVSGKFLGGPLTDWAERQTAVLWFDRDRVRVADGGGGDD